MQKTAGTSINYIFRNNFGWDFISTRPSYTKKDIFNRAIFTKEDLNFFLKINKKIKCIAGHSVRTYSDLEEIDIPLKYMTFLRDPVSRYLSHYNHHINYKKDNMPFEKWMENPRQSNFQVKFLANEDNLSKAKEILENKFLFVGLAEEFDISLILMKHLLFLPASFNIKYQKRNISSGYKLNKKNLSPDILDKIKEKNKLDILLYKHVKNHIFEEQKKRYGKNLLPDLNDFKKSLKNFKFNFIQILKYRIAHYFIYKLADFRKYNK